MMRVLSPASRLPLAVAAIGLALLTGAAAVLYAGSDPASAGIAATVYVNNSQFCGSPGANCGQPYEIQINPGDNVQWIDGESGLFHSVTQCSGNGTGCPAPGGFDSGTQSDPAGPYLTESFADAGTYFYRCQVHLNSMRGVITVGNPATPTPTPSPAPTPSPTASASATPTASPSPPASGTATPTPTGTATAAPTPTPTPTGSPGPPGRSDVNCDGQTDGEDVLAILFHRSAETGVAGCAPIGSPEGDESKGDLNCDGSIDAADALIALRVWAELPVDDFVPENCPAP